VKKARKTNEIVVPTCEKHKNVELNWWNLFTAHPEMRHLFRDTMVKSKDPHILMIVSCFRKTEKAMNLKKQSLHDFRKIWEEKCIKEEKEAEEKQSQEVSR
jgi:hypothetical protein